jgi:hypothetical protein
MTSPRNHACPKCDPVSDKDLKRMADEIADLLFTIYAVRGGCGEAVLKASILHVVQVAQNMNASGLHFDIDKELAMCRSLVTN